MTNAVEKEYTFVKLADLLAKELEEVVRMDKTKTKCLLYNKESNAWNTTYDREQDLKTENLFDALSVGVSQG